MQNSLALSSTEKNIHEPSEQIVWQQREDQFPWNLSQAKRKLQDQVIVPCMQEKTI